MGDIWGNRFEEYGYRVFDSLGYDYKRSEKLESESRIHPTDIDGRIRPKVKSPSLLIKPSLQNKYSKIYIEYKTGEAGRSLVKALTDETIDPPQRSNHRLYQIMRNSADLADDINEEFLYLVVTDYPIIKEDNSELEIDLGEKAEANNSFTEDDMDNIDEYANCHIIGPGRLSLYLTKKHISLYFQREKRHKDAIEGSSLQEILVPDIDEDQIVGLLQSGDSIVDYRDRGKHEYLEDISLFMSMSSIQGGKTHRSITLDLFIDREELMNKDAFREILSKVKNYLVYYLFKHRQGNIKKNMEFSIDIGVHYLGSEYDNSGAIREDLSELINNYFSGSRNSELMQLFQSTRDKLVEENYLQNNHELNWDCGDFFRIYDYESFGLGTLTYMSGLSFYFRGI